MKRLHRLLEVLAASWDEERYFKGVDAQGEQQPKPAQARREGAQGFAVFDPKLMTATLREGRFHAYVFMAFRVEETPTQLAHLCEECPCHRQLLSGMNQYQRQNILQHHYGSGNNRCFMAGKCCLRLSRTGSQM